MLSYSEGVKVEKIDQFSVQINKEVMAMRILIVDDDAFSRDLVVCMLEDTDRQIDVAGNGLEALRLLTQNRYNLVLMDCNMSVMDGYTATRIIRGSSAVINTQVPIIALSATTDLSTRTACKLAGMDDCLTKPVNQDELEEILKRWL